MLHVEHKKYAPLCSLCGGRFIEGIPNTLKYWQKCKFELIAKMDNFGPFSIFFTLSCADTRWEGNFVDILRDLGYIIRISTNYIDRDTEVVYEASSDGLTWKPFEDFIKEDVNVSHHELIRKNVVTATRYFEFFLCSFPLVLKFI